MDWSDHNHVNSVLLKPDITIEESQKLYSQWAKDGEYDQDVGDNYKDEGTSPHFVAVVMREVKDTGSLILDIGAGMGLSGDVIKQQGYTNLHALEPCAEFAEMCRKKNIYSKIHQCFIGGGKKLDISDSCYDAVVTMGAMGPGHCPADSLMDMCRIVKPGGHVIIVMREEYLRTVPEYADRLEPLWTRMEEDGKWKILERSTFPNHYAGKDGLVLVFKVC